MSKYKISYVAFLFMGVCLITSCSDDDKDYINSTNESSLTVGEQVAVKTGGTVGLVDLGLPSGTKWADRNIGATSQISYGDYYAWSETRTKETYNYENYVGLDVESSIDIAGTQYDAATVVWGEGWSMPTKAQCEELMDNCEWEWVKIDKTYGQKVTGPNGNSIFIPEAGYISDDDGRLVSANFKAYYWSSSISKEMEPYNFNFEGTGSADLWSTDGVDKLSDRSRRNRKIINLRRLPWIRNRGEVTVSV